MNYILKTCLTIINQDMEQQGKIHHVFKTVVKNITTSSITFVPHFELRSNWVSYGRAIRLNQKQSKYFLIDSIFCKLFAFVFVSTVKLLGFKQLIPMA